MIESIKVTEVATQVNVECVYMYCASIPSVPEARAKLANKLRRLADEVEEGNDLEQRYPGLVSVELSGEEVVRPATQWADERIEQKAVLVLRIPRGVA